MQFLKLTPLQSRFLASFVASAILVVLYLTLTSPQFAYAVDFDSRIPPDHNHPIISATDFQLQEQTVDLDDDEEIVENLHSVSSRATEAIVSALENNSPQNLNIDFGQTQNWIFSMQNIKPGITGPQLPHDNTTDAVQVQARDELRRRQDEQRVYVTVNTCLQPMASDPGNSGNIIPPQLTMYISTNPSNTNPGPFVSDPQQQIVEFSGGYALATVNASNDVHVGISALNVTGFIGSWNYEIAASVDAPYHSVNETWSNLFFVDGDNHAALLITNDTTEANASSPVYQEWMSMTPPYGVFAHNMNDSSILGVKNSYCGLLKYAQIMANVPSVNNQNVAGMTNRGLGGKPKEQFYINDLNATSRYWGFLAMAGNSTPGVIGGGGKVWMAMNFTTKTGKLLNNLAHIKPNPRSHTNAESNCALMYNLSFCSEVAYAVPANPNKFSPTTGLQELAATYDKNAADWYQLFNYSLQQIACNTTSDAQYSLARNCDDCASAYKQWLCAVTIPRCEDFSNQSPWLKPRNTAQNFVNGSSLTFSANDATGQALLNSVATNQSRNPLIDSAIAPGPYKEVLPCEDLCYDLVQSCPAILGFGCPISGKGLEQSYGKRSNDSGIITCSYLGAAYYLSGSGRQRVLEIGWTALAAVITGVLLLL
jgi:calcium channel MID1